MPDARLFSNPSAPNAPPARLFARNEQRPLIQYPIQHVVIDWGRLITKRPLVLDTIRYVPTADPFVKDRIQSYLWAGRFKQFERIFPIVRQTVNHHINALVRESRVRAVQYHGAQAAPFVRDSFNSARAAAEICGVIISAPDD